MTKDKTNKSRKESLTIRLNESELSSINFNAQTANMNLSEYARNILIDGRVFYHETKSLDELNFQIKQLGNNLNQLMRFINIKVRQRDLSIPAQKEIIMLARDVTKELRELQEYRRARTMR